ncbi:MAG: glycosyltransferase family 2 protein [Myxococcales bacterium]|nr:glycosyltransferase family 2 protein [Myxococcales bacterium]
MPKASIIMRSRNDEEIIQRTLEGLRRQTVTSWELIHIDSDSTDRTAHLIAPYASIQKIIPAHTYIPGAVLNDGARLSKSKNLIFLNSDCVPLHNTWLEEMLLGLNASPVVYGRQVAREDATLQVQRDYLYAFPPEPSEKTNKRWRSNPSFENFFSMACCGMRRAVWEQYPFHETIRYSEDIEWALQIRNAGIKISYLPNARVEHSHNYDAKSCYRRFFGEGTAEAATFSESPWETSLVRRAIMPYMSALWSDLRYAAETKRLQEWPRSVWFRWAMHYGRYRGIQQQKQIRSTAYGAQNPNAGLPQSSAS